MSDREIAVVGWGELNSKDALYGSALTVTPSGEAHLVNHLMPSGTTLQEWYSFTDYQAVRDTPELPLLRHGARYRVVADVTSAPAGTTLLEVRFHDRFGDEVDRQVLHAPDHAFTYPPGGHSYTIRLVNAGCDEVWFRSLRLLEAPDEQQGGAR
jgi:accessory secretory protein Asp3